MSTFQIVSFGLATGSGMAYLYVAINNWRVMLRRLRRPGERSESLVFLAGPIMAVLLVQGLRFAGAPWGGRELGLIVLLCLLLDPAALPASLSALLRWLRRRLK